MADKPPIKLYFCTCFGDLSEIQRNSPRMAEVIATETECAVMNWDGRAQSLFIDEMVLVFVPDGFPDAEYRSIIDTCDQMCHFPFYLDQPLQRSCQGLSVVVAFRNWLEEFHQEPEPTQ